MLNRLFNIFWSRINPYARGMDAHPLLWIEAKKAPEWAQSADRLARRTVYLMSVGFFGGLVFFGLLMLLGPPDLVGFVLFWSLLITFLIIDSRAISVSIGSINTDFVNGLWDSLRITSLSEQGIIRAKHAATQLRTWRSISLIAGLRLSVFVTFEFQFISALLSESTLPNDDPLSIAIMWGVIALSGILLIALVLLEPFWRMRSTAAIGLAISARIENIPLANIVAGMVLIGVWIGQLIIVVISNFVTGIPLVTLLYAVIAVNGLNTVMAFQLVMVIFVSAVSMALMIGILRASYMIVQDIALRRVLSRLQK